MSEVESPAVKPAPAVEEPKKPAAKKAEPKKRSHNFDLDDGTVHRNYFIPPPGYTKPTFPTAQ